MSYRDQEEHLEIGEQKEGDGLLKSSKEFLSLYKSEGKTFLPHY